jgi:hypothetical protein
MLVGPRSVSTSQLLGVAKLETVADALDHRHEFAAGDLVFEQAGGCRRAEIGEALDPRHFLAFGVDQADIFGGCGDGKGAHRRHQVGLAFRRR